MIASSLVFLYFGTKIVFIEDITKLLPQEGPASKSSLVFGDLKVKDMIILQVTSDQKKGPELAQMADEFTEQLMQADSASIANIISGINTEEFLENNLDRIEEGKEYVRSLIPTLFDESQIRQFDSLLTSEALDSTMMVKSCQLTGYLDEGDFDKYNSTWNMLSEDPAGLLTTMLPADRPDFTGGLKFIDGHIMSADSTVVLAFLAPSFNSMESAKCADFIRTLEKESERFEKANPDADILFHGLPVNSAYNSRQLKKDVALTIGISLVIICIIFGFIFHNKS